LPVVTHDLDLNPFADSALPNWPPAQPGRPGEGDQSS